MCPMAEEHHAGEFVRATGSPTAPHDSVWRAVALLRVTNFPLGALEETKFARLKADLLAAVGRILLDVG